MAHMMVLHTRVSSSCLYYSVRLTSCSSGCSASSIQPLCTGYANDGMNIKDLQYLMGHSDAAVTLNVYSHASYTHAADQLAKIRQFRKEADAV